MSHEIEDILGDSLENFNARWDQAPTAHDVGDALPAGTYRALVVDGAVATSRKGTRSYKVTFQILEPAEHAGRKVFHDFWFSDAALPYSKRDLAKLGIKEVDQLFKPPASGITVNLRLACEETDNGKQVNKVVNFVVVSAGADNGRLAPAMPQPDPLPSSTDDEDIPF
jgi:hypothetical protein